MTQCILRTSPREGRKLKNTSIYSNDFISISIQFYIAIDPINIIVRTVNNVERRIPIQFIIILKRGDERLDPEEGTGRFKNFPSGLAQGNSPFLVFKKTRKNRRLPRVSGASCCRRKATLYNNSNKKERERGVAQEEKCSTCRCSTRMQKGAPSF